MKQFFEKQWRYNRQRLFVVVLAFFLFTGFLQAMFGLEYVLRLTPIMLTIVACTSVVFWDASIKAKLWASGIVVAGTFIIELIGVQTGLIFGDYAYGKLLGLTIFGAPITIGITWLLVTLSAWHIVALNTKPLLQRFLLGGVLVVMFDLILEQFAVAYGLWSWQGGVIPLYNYLCWFIVTMLCFFVYHKLAPKVEPSLFIVCVLPLMALFFWLMLVIA